MNKNLGISLTWRYESEATVIVPNLKGACFTHRSIHQRPSKPGLCHWLRLDDVCGEQNAWTQKSQHLVSAGLLLPGKAALKRSLLSGTALLRSSRSGP